MSLDWSARKVYDYEALHSVGLELLITEAIVFHTLGIGMGDITASNWQEFYARVAFMENLDTPSLTVPNDVEFDPTVLMPPEGTKYITIDGELYHYDGFDPEFMDEWEEPVDPDDPNPDGEYRMVHHMTTALFVTEYTYVEGMGPRRGVSMVMPIDPDADYAYHDGFEKRPITPQDVHRRIGLTTNVSHESRTAWAKRITDRYLTQYTQRAEAKVRDYEYQSEYTN